MTTVELRKCLEEVAVKNAEKDWFSSLEDRKIKELEFHNKDRDKELTASLPHDTFEALHGNKKFYSITESSVEYIKEWIRTNAKDKVFLDYACGNGHNAINAAEAGAALSIGMDISDISVSNCRETAKEAGLEQNTFFFQGDCENTGLPDNSVDAIVCSGMLHHLDLNHAFPELRRILKPGGRILCIEALDYNPAIKLYRIMTPSMRTEWEKDHILSHKDVRFAKNFFNVENIKYWHLFAIGAVAFRNNQKIFDKAAKMLDKVDKFALKIPGFRLMAWQFTFELVKPESN